MKHETETRKVVGTLLIDEKSKRRKLCPVCHDHAGLTLERIHDHNNFPAIQTQIVCHNCGWIVSKYPSSAKIKYVVK